jgi:TetR/AcrR family transcriptional regulator
MVAKAIGKPSKRAPGRPQAGGADPRDALLDAAKLAFARRGFTGASLREIAREAGVTAALANYYFGDKAGLLGAVIDLRVAPLAAALGATIEAAGDDAEAALRAFVATYVATAARNRWLPQLIMREVLHEDGVLRETFATRFAGGMAGALLRVVARGQHNGVLRGDLAPERLVMSLLSLCIFPFLATPLVSGALGIRVDEASAAALAEHHLAIFLAGARPDRMETSR